MQKLDVSEMSRKRSPNFTKKENKVLAELIQVYEETIESKKTDHTTNVGKTRAWHELANDFNARMGGDPYRSATVLKHRYENIKKEIRRDLRKKQNSNNPENSAIDPLDNFHSYVSNSDDTEMENEIDIKETIRVKLMSDDTMDQDDFNNIAHSLGENAVQSHPQSPQNKKIPEPICWANISTSSFEEMQKKCFWEEHKLKLQHMKEKHFLEMECMRQDYKERIRIMRQEHDTKMEMLELEKTVGLINKI